MSWYDTKQSDGDAPGMLELWEMQSTPLLPSLQGKLRLGLVTLDEVQSMTQIELLNILIESKEMI